MDFEMHSVNCEYIIERIYIYTFLCVHMHISIFASFSRAILIVSSLAHAALYEEGNCLSRRGLNRWYKILHLRGVRLLYGGSSCGHPLAQLPLLSFIV